MANLNNSESEVLETLKPVLRALKFIGISLNDDHYSFLMRFLRFFTTVAATGLVSALMLHFVLIFNKSRITVADFAECLHILGYGSMGFIKIQTLYRKRPLYKQLVQELIELWPETTEKEAEEIKRRSVNQLRFGSTGYTFLNIGGWMLYCLTPIGIYLYRIMKNESADLGFIYIAAYPFDKTKPVNHGLVYLNEACGALLVVIGMIGSDLLFTSMSSNVSLLLRLLQIKIRGLGASGKLRGPLIDCYQETISVIKLHQKLISFSNRIEDMFTFLNLLNVLLSSINICCVAFSIVLLEPWNTMGSKFYLGASLSQMLILCWYAEEIYRASLGIGDAVFESGWYKSNPASRRAMLMLILRSQKPIIFTAMKFGKIKLTTYTSILINSYSYFTLLYTLYRE